MFLVGAFQASLAEPVVGPAGGVGVGGGGAGAVGAGVEFGVEALGVEELGVEELGVELGLPAAVAAAAVEPAGDTPTPLPQALRSSPAITGADSENNVLRGLIAGMPGLKYGHLLDAICRSLRT